MLAPLYPATHSQWLQKGGKLGEWKHPEKLKHDAFVVFQIKQAQIMCVYLHFRLASRLAPFPPCVALGCHPGSVNRKKKGAKERQDKDFWSMNLTTYQVYHAHSMVGGSVSFVCTISRCLLSSTNYPFTILQVKAPEGKPYAPHVVQDVRKKKEGFVKYKKVFSVFRTFYWFPFLLPQELPSVVCYAGHAFRGFAGFV